MAEPMNAVEWDARWDEALQTEATEGPAAAERILRSMLEATPPPDREDDVVTLHAVLGDAAMDRDDWEQAEDHYRQGILLAAELPVTPATAATCLLGLARMAWQVDEADDAIELASHAVEVFDMYNDVGEDRAEALCFLAEIAVEQVRIEEALTHLDDAFSQVPDAPDTTLTRGQLWLQRANAHNYADNTAEAIPAFRQAVACLEGEGLDDDASDMLRRFVGHAHAQLCLLETDGEAIVHHGERAANLLQDVPEPNPVMMAAVHEKTGAALMEMRDPGRALRPFERAEAWLTQVDDCPVEVLLPGLLFQGLCHMSAGRHQKAIDIFVRCDRLAASAEVSATLRMQARTLWIHTLAGSGNKHRALELLGATEDLLEQVDEPAAIAQFHLVASVVYQQLEDPERSRHHAQLLEACQLLQSDLNQFAGLMPLLARSPESVVSDMDAVAQAFLELRPDVVSVDTLAQSWGTAFGLMGSGDLEAAEHMFTQVQEMAESSGMDGLTIGSGMTLAGLRLARDPKGAVALALREVDKLDRIRHEYRGQEQRRRWSEFTSRGYSIAIDIVAAHGTAEQLSDLIVRARLAGITLLDSDGPLHPPAPEGTEDPTDGPLTASQATASLLGTGDDSLLLPPPAATLNAARPPRSASLHVTLNPRVHVHL